MEITQEDVFQSATKYDVKLLKKCNQRQYVDKLQKRITALRSKCAPPALPPAHTHMPPMQPAQKQDAETSYWQKLNLLRRKYMPLMEFCQAELNKLLKRLTAKSLQLCLLDDDDDAESSLQHKCQQKLQVVRSTLSNLDQMLGLLSKAPGNSAGKIDMSDLKRIVTFIPRRAKPLAKQLQRQRKRDTTSRQRRTPHSIPPMPSATTQQAIQLAVAQEARTTVVEIPPHVPTAISVSAFVDDLLEKPAPKQQPPATPDDLLELVQ